jgi:hypothetical protein
VGTGPVWRRAGVRDGRMWGGGRGAGGDDSAGAAGGCGRRETAGSRGEQVGTDVEA